MLNRQRNEAKDDRRERAWVEVSSGKHQDMTEEIKMASEFGGQRVLGRGA